MLVVISPAKTLDFKYINSNIPTEVPIFLEEATEIMNELKKYDSYSISKLMKIKGELLKLTKERIENWDRLMDSTKQCLFSFKGDVYKAIDVGSFTDEEIFYSNNTLRILSGVYGVLKPLDGIKPYRLEMGTRISVNGYKNLYEFWGDEIINSLVNELKFHSEKIIINLASKEYFKSIEGIKKNNDIKVVTPILKEERNGELKIISRNAKIARGLMTRFIIENKIKSINDITRFTAEGYIYYPELSTATELVFIKRDLS